MESTRQIIAIGGVTAPEDVALFRYVVAQARVPKPRVGFLATASGDSATYVARFYEQFSSFPCERSHLGLFGRVPDLERYFAEQDVFLVSGGNTASMLALWRAWGIDVLLRRAWEEGAVLAGFSAGAICWFSEGPSDSWADRLVPVAGLDLIAGSCCPHYSNEPERRPVFRDLIARGEMQPGIGIDDGVAVHFRGAELITVAARAGAGAYPVATHEGVISEKPLVGKRVLLGAG